jgi:hypothetical protein
VPDNFATTPLIADPHHTGKLGSLDYPGTSIRREETDWRALRWQLLRLDLAAAAPAMRAWAGYMGTAGNGHYTPSTK